MENLFAPDIPVGPKTTVQASAISADHAKSRKHLALAENAHRVQNYFAVLLLNSMLFNIFKPLLHPRLHNKNILAVFKMAITLSNFVPIFILV